MNLTKINVIVVLHPGAVYDFTIPSLADNDYGYSPMGGTAEVNGNKIELQNGFGVENESAGIIHKVYDDAVKISYWHKLAMNNTIYYFSALGHQVSFTVGNITPHDHASISTGGPAYGTYFATPTGG